MRNSVLASLVMAFTVGAAVLPAEDKPVVPGPVKEHAWLKQLEGEWESESEMTIEEGQPPMKCKGSEKTRMIGELWSESDGKSEFMGTTIQAAMTLGYDAEQKQYVGTWVDSMMPYLWKYEGKLDDTGKILTLEAEGPCPWAGNKMTKFRDIIEIKDKDYRTLTNMYLKEDGKWTKMGITHARRKK